MNDIDIKKQQREQFLKGASAKDKGLGGHVRDTVLSGFAGAASVPEIAVGLLDIPTGGRVGNALSNDRYDILNATTAKNFFNDLKTDRSKEQLQEFTDTEGFGAKLNYARKNPSLISNTVIESLPTMGAGGVIGRGIGLAAKGLSPVVAGALGEGAVGAGLAAESIRQQTDDGMLTPKQAGLAAATGVTTAGFGFAGGKLAQKLGIGDVDTIIAGGGRTANPAANIAGSAAANASKDKGILRRGAEGVLSEGLLEELPQSVSETILQNEALGTQGEGVADAAALGLLSGGLMGAGAGAFARNRRPDERITPTEDMGQESSNYGSPTGGSDAGFNPAGLLENKSAPQLGFQGRESNQFNAGPNGDVFTGDQYNEYLAGQQERARNERDAGQQPRSFEDVTPINQGYDQFGNDPRLPAPNDFTVTPDGTVQTGSDVNTTLQNEQQARIEERARRARGEILDRIRQPGDNGFGDFDSGVSDESKQSGALLGLPAPDGTDFTASQDGQVYGRDDINTRLSQERDAAAERRARIARGEILDRTPIPEAPKPSELMGLDLNKGGLSAAAVIAVDSGASDVGNQVRESLNQERAISVWQSGMMDRLEGADQNNSIYARLAQAMQNEPVSVSEKTRLMREADALPRAEVAAKQIKPNTRVLDEARAQTKAYTPEGKEVKAQWDVVDASDLVTSNTDSFTINPDFPSSRQPRDRTRASAQQQVNEIASKLQPNLLGESPDVSTGAPFVGANDNVVDSGNGRSMAIRRVYQEGGEKAGEYRQFVNEQAAKFGLDTDAVNMMQSPVLVRRNTSDMNRDEFARAANKPTAARMSSTEQAASDAKSLPDASLLSFNGDGNMSLYQSQSYLKNFIAALPKTEQGSLMDDKGTLSREGENRIEAAIVQDAYNNPKLVSAISEKLDNDTTNVLRAVTDKAPQISQINADIKTGDVYDNTLARDIADATQAYMDIKNSEQDVDDYLSQDSLFDDGLTDGAKEILGVLSDNRRSAKAIGEYIQSRINEVTGRGNPKQGGLSFDDDIETDAPNVLSDAPAPKQSPNSPQAATQLTNENPMVNIPEPTKSKGAGNTQDVVTQSNAATNEIVPVEGWQNSRADAANLIRQLYSAGYLPQSDLAIIARRGDTKQLTDIANKGLNNQRENSKQQGKVVSPESKATAIARAEKAISAVTEKSKGRLDHGELSIPNRTKNINKELDKYNAAKEKQDKREREDKRFLANERELARKPARERAEELYKEHGKLLRALIKDKVYGTGNTPAEFLKNEIVVNPENFIKMVEQAVSNEAAISRAKESSKPATAPDVIDGKPSKHRSVKDIAQSYDLSASRVSQLEEKLKGVQDVAKLAGVKINTAAKYYQEAYDDAVKTGSINPNKTYVSGRRSATADYSIAAAEAAGAIEFAKNDNTEDRRSRDLAREKVETARRLKVKEEEKQRAENKELKANESSLVKDTFGLSLDEIKNLVYRPYNKLEAKAKQSKDVQDEKNADRALRKARQDIFDIEDAVIGYAKGDMDADEFLTSKAGEISELAAVVKPPQSSVAKSETAPETQKPTGDWQTQMNGNEFRINEDGITVRKHDRVVHIRGATSITASKKAKELANQNIRELHYIAAKDDANDPFSEGSIWLDGNGDMVRKKGTKKPTGSLLPILKQAEAETKKAPRELSDRAMVREMQKPTINNGDVDYKAKLNLSEGQNIGRIIMSSGRVFNDVVVKSMGDKSVTVEATVDGKRGTHKGLNYETLDTGINNEKNYVKQQAAKKQADKSVGNPKFSRAATQEQSKTNKGSTNTTRQQVIDKLNDKFGKETIDKLMADGKLDIKVLSDYVVDGQLTIPSDVDGLYQNGKATLIADNLSDDMIIPTFLHELGGHGGMQGLMDKKAYDALMKDFDALVKAGDPLAMQAKAMADKVARNEQDALDEYLPYLITLTSRQQAKQGKVAGMINRMVMAIRSWLKNTLGVPIAINSQDILALAERMVNEIEKQAAMSRSNRINSQFSRAEDIDLLRDTYGYRDSHLAPDADEGFNAAQMSEAYPEIDDPSFTSHYGDGYSYDGKAVKVMREMAANPNAMFMVYRAVPLDSDAENLNYGDWVSLTKDYADVHGQSRFNGDYKIIKEKVKGLDLYTDSNSIHEWGYAPKSSSIYAARKSLKTEIESFNKTLDKDIYRDPVSITDVLAGDGALKNKPSVAKLFLDSINQDVEVVYKNPPLSESLIAMNDDVDGINDVFDLLENHPDVLSRIHDEVVVKKHREKANSKLKAVRARAQAEVERLTSLPSDDKLTNDVADAFMAIKEYDQNAVNDIDELSTIKNAVNQALNQKSAYDDFVGALFVDNIDDIDLAKEAVESSNDGMKFSRAAGMNDELDPRNIAKETATRLYDWASSAPPGKLSWWHKTIGTMYNLAQRNPYFKPVFENTEKFINDVSFYAAKASELAPRLLPQLDSLRDITKSAIGAKDNEALSKPIFEGTLLWGRDLDGKAVLIEDWRKKVMATSKQDRLQMLKDANRITPAQEAELATLNNIQANRFINGIIDEEVNAGLVWTDSELRSKFDLSDGQIELYREFRSATDKSLDSLTRSDMLRKLGKVANDIEAAVMEAGTLDDAISVIEQHINSLSTAEPRKAQALAGTFADIKASAGRTKGLMDDGYAPLSRFGQYTVDVVDADGNREYFGMFESAYEARKMKAEMDALYGNDNNYAVTQGALSNEEFKLFAGVTPETAELFGEMLGLDATGDKAADEAFQEYLKRTKNNRSAMKRLMHRKGIKGYSEDVGRVLASFIYSNARHTSAALNMGNIDRAITDIPKGEGQLKDAAVKLAEYIKNPQEEAQLMRGWMFAQYLGGSIASAVVNLTQPIAVSFPYLSQFGGAVKAASQLSKASSDWTKAFTDKSRSHFEPHLLAAIEKAEADGTLSPQEVHNLLKQASGKNPLSAGDGTKVGDARALAGNTLSRVSLAWGALFSGAEQINRRVTFVAAYRMAVEQGMANPAEFATNSIKETQFVYNKASRMNWGRGAVGGTLMTFKTYTVSYIELMHRLWNQGEKGSPERAQGRKATMIMLGVMFMLSGSGGLPFMEDAEDLIDGIGQIMGYNFSTKKSRQDFLDAWFGEMLGDFLESGASTLPGSPTDVSGRLGLGNLIPGTGILKERTNNTRDVLEIAGPAGDFAGRIATGTRDIAKGVANLDATSLKKGALEFAPTAVRNAVKGVDMASSGIYKDTKGYKVTDVSPVDAAFKFAGFQPLKVSKIQEANYLGQTATSYYSLRASNIRALWAAGVVEGNSSKVADAKAAVKDWNEKNPDQKIVIKPTDIARRVREMKMEKSERVTKLAPKSMRAQMAQDFSQVRDGF